MTTEPLPQFRELMLPDPSAPADGIPAPQASTAQVEQFELLLRNAEAGSPRADLAVARQSRVGSGSGEIFDNRRSMPETPSHRERFTAAKPSSDRSDGRVDDRPVNERPAAERSDHDSDHDSGSRVENDKADKSVKSGDEEDPIESESADAADNAEAEVDGEASSTDDTDGAESAEVASEVEVDAALALMAEVAALPNAVESDASLGGESAVDVEVDGAVEHVAVAADGTVVDEVELEAAMVEAEVASVVADSAETTGVAAVVADGLDEAANGDDPLAVEVAETGTGEPVESEQVVVEDGSEVASTERDTAESPEMSGVEDAAVETEASMSDTPDTAAPVANTATRPNQSAATEGTRTNVSGDAIARVDAAGGPDQVRRAQVRPTAEAGPIVDGDPGEPVWLQVRRAMNSLRTLENGDQQVTVRLRPAELGSVMVRVAAGEARTAVTLVAESAVAVTQLAQQRDSLVSELERSGLLGVAVDIGSGPGADQSNASADGDQDGEGESPSGLAAGQSGSDRSALAEQLLSRPNGSSSSGGLIDLDL